MDPQLYTATAPLLGLGLAPEKTQPSGTMTGASSSPLALVQRIPATLSTTARMRTGHGPLRVWRNCVVTLRGQALFVQTHPTPTDAQASSPPRRQRTQQPSKTSPSTTSESEQIALEVADVEPYGSDGFQAGRVVVRDHGNVTVTLELPQPVRENWILALRRARDTRIGLSDFVIQSPIGKGGGGKVFLVTKSSKGSSPRTPPATPPVSETSSRTVPTAEAPNASHDLDASTETSYAMKVVQKYNAFYSDGSLRHALDERLALQLLAGHPYIVRLRHAFQTEKALYLITDFARGGDLRGLLNKHPGGRLPEKDPATKRIMAQLVLALDHVHSHNIIYRDLKPENVLLSASGDVQLCDFGLSKVLQTGRWGRTRSFCGTTSYMSPETVGRQRPYGIASDLWGLGALFYRILVGRGPFDDARTRSPLARAADDSEMYRRIRQDDVVFPTRASGILSEDAESLLSGLLAKDEMKRMNLEEVKESAYFDGLDWDALLAEGKNAAARMRSFSYGNLSTLTADGATRDAQTDDDALVNFDLASLGDVQFDEQEFASERSLSSQGSATTAPRKKSLLKRVKGSTRMKKRPSATSVIGYAYSEDIAHFLSESDTDSS